MYVEKPKVSTERTRPHMAQTAHCCIPRPLTWYHPDQRPHVTACCSILEQRFQYSDSIFPFQRTQHSSFHQLNIASLKTRGNRGRVKDKHVDGVEGKKKKQKSRGLWSWEGLYLEQSTAIGLTRPNMSKGCNQYMLWVFLLYVPLPLSIFSFLFTQIYITDCFQLKLKCKTETEWGREGGRQKDNQ